MNADTSVFSLQCMQPAEACTSMDIGTILNLMMNTKTSTKPLVVVPNGQEGIHPTDTEFPGKANQHVAGQFSHYMDQVVMLPL